MGNAACREIIIVGSLRGVKRKYLTILSFSCNIAEVIKMDEIFKQALLYDFYGELLTEHQKEIYEQFVLEDLSLSEIALSAGISRQGVHDMVRRCQRILEGYEEKLQLVEKFVSIKEKVHEIDRILETYGNKKTDTKKMIADIRRIADKIIEEL